MIVALIWVNSRGRIHSPSVQFSRSVVSDSLQPHGLQHARPPCPSPIPRVYSNSCPLSRWCHPAISSSVVPFSSCPQTLPASGSFPSESTLRMRWPKYWGFSFSISPSNEHQDWSPLGWTQSIVSCKIRMKVASGRLCLSSLPCMASFSFLSCFPRSFSCSQAGFPWKHFVNKSLKLESYSQVCFWGVNWDDPSPNKLQVWALINGFHEKAWSQIFIDTPIRRFKKKRKERKDRKCLQFSSVGYRHETSFFF